MKKIIRLTESDLHKIIENSVKRFMVMEKNNDDIEYDDDLDFEDNIEDSDIDDDIEYDDDSDLYDDLGFDDDSDFDDIEDDDSDFDDIEGDEDLDFDDIEGDEDLDFEDDDDYLYEDDDEIPDEEDNTDIEDFEGKSEEELYDRMREIKSKLKELHNEKDLKEDDGNYLIQQGALKIGGKNETPKKYRAVKAEYDKWKEEYDKWKEKFNQQVYDSWKEINSIRMYLGLQPEAIPQADLETIAKIKNMQKGIDSDDKKRLRKFGREKKLNNLRKEIDADNVPINDVDAILGF